MNCVSFSVPGHVVALLALLPALLQAFPPVVRPVLHLFELRFVLEPVGFIGAVQVAPQSLNSAPDLPLGHGGGALRPRISLLRDVRGGRASRRTRLLHEEVVAMLRLFLLLRPATAQFNLHVEPVAPAQEGHVVPLERENLLVLLQIDRLQVARHRLLRQLSHLVAAGHQRCHCGLHRDLLLDPHHFRFVRYSSLLQQFLKAALLFWEEYDVNALVVEARAAPGPVDKLLHV